MKVYAIVWACIFLSLPALFLAVCGSSWLLGWLNTAHPAAPWLLIWALLAAVVAAIACSDGDSL